MISAASTKCSHVNQISVLAIVLSTSAVACLGPVPMDKSQTGGSGDRGGVSGTGGATIPLVVGGTTGSETGAGNSTPACEDKILVVFRDFRGCSDDKGPRHPDFEQGNNVPDRGIVEATLGPDQKPVYAHGSKKTLTVQNADTFGQWYRDNDGISKRFESSLSLTPSATDPTLKIYDSTAFFPLDGQGWGNQACQGGQHNYSFTTEIHTTFTYKGGESFTFRGDDDVFAYVNNKLVIDLGGIHVAQTGTVNMDEQAEALGIVKGGTYPMDIFHAERHIIYSNFRMETRFECLSSIVIP